MINTEFPDMLLQSYERGAVIAVVGAGFTSATSPGSTGASWVQLIREAAATLTAKDASYSSKQLIIDSLIAEATSSGSAADLLVAASMVRQRFLQDGEQAFANFLYDHIGTLRVQDGALGKAISALKVPVATTNYDQLLEHALETDNSTTWENKPEMMRILRNETRGVAHLHGVWNKPKSVVFSAEDYERLSADEGILFGEASAFEMQTFLFIGMGAGALDPNFTNILQHLKKSIGTSNHYHYLLCRNSEVAEVESKFANTTIRPLSFGDDFEDLPGYLRALQAKTGPARQRVTENARTAKNAWNKIAHDINANRLNSSEVFDESSILETLVEPTFLPLSHEQFVFEKRKRDEAHGDQAKDIEPLAPAQILDGKAVTIVVGEEHGGLTTTLQWLCLRYAQSAQGVIPMVVDARGIRSQDRLGGVLRRELNVLGAESKRADPLPKIALAVDNLTYRENEKFKQFCQDIANTQAERIFVGCQLGNEAEIATLLESLGAEPQTVYLGKLGKPEIAKYAVIIAPGISDHMIRRVFELIRKEHLPRNPFTVSMILALMLQAASRPDLLQSQTDVLNEYMQLLLSHGGGTLDARETLSVINLERVLVALAKEFVTKRSGSLPEADCVSLLQKLFDDLDWIESPASWLERLKNMRVLRNEGSQYFFRQSSYLYLYAAKAAVSDSDFMKGLLREPLFFAPIIKHCAALQRDNTDLVSATASLLSPWREHIHRGTIFLQSTKREAPEVEEPQSTKVIQEEEQDKKSAEQDQGVSSSEATPPEYDLSADADVIPFPLHDLAQTTQASQLFIAVDLASNVLRDSDAVSVKEAKDSALLTIMHSWGVLIDLMETDERLVEGGRQIIEEGIAMGFYSREVAMEILEHVHRNYACLFVLNGIRESLRSRKLKPAIDRLYAQNSVVNRSIYATTAAAFLELLSRQGAWSSNLVKLCTALEGRWVSLKFISYFVRVGYIIEDLGSNEREDYKKIIAVQADNAFTFKNQKHRNRFLRHSYDRLDTVRSKFLAYRSIRRQKTLS